MAALGQTISLARGVPVKLNTSGIAGAGTLGFVIPAYPNEGAPTLTVQAVPGGGAVTTLTASLQAALDKITFNDLVAAANFVTSTGPVLLKQVLNPPTGVPLQINLTSASGGFDIWVVAN